MQTIEIWPTDFEFGDALGQGELAGTSFTYVKLIDAQAGLEVIICLDPPTAQTLLDKGGPTLRALILGAGGPH